MKPWLSVIVPTYNGARYIAEALESVRLEGTSGLEVIAVDDGSTDGTLDILGSFGASLPLRILRPGRTGNWVANTNVGLREARGRYACILHQDDFWMPGRIRALRAEAETGAVLVTHQSLFVGPDGHRLGKLRCPLRAGSIDSNLFLERLLIQNFISIPSAMFDRAEAVQSGGLDEFLWYTADWELWLRLCRFGRIRHLPEPLAAFRVHPESQTVARPTDDHERRVQHSTVLERYLPACAPVRQGQIRRAAEFSIEVNVLLAAAARRSQIKWSPLFEKLLRLGPRDCVRFWRDSRIVERVGARLRVRS